MRSFSKRMWRAIAFIESGAEHSRQLDEAFENFDGHAMEAALNLMAQKRPRLAGNLARYISSSPDNRHRGKTMPEIRQAAYQERLSCWSEMHGPCPKH